MPIKPEMARSPMMDGPPGRNLSPLLPPEYRIYLLNKRLQEASVECDNLWWDALTCEFFEDSATLTISVFMDDGPKSYTIGRTLIPRYFRSIYDGGAAELYFITRHTNEMFNHSTHSITLTSAQSTMVMHHPKPILTKVCTDGHLTIEFSYDEFMRIRSWHFEIHCHSELAPKQVLQDPSLIEKLGGNVTKRGMTPSTINYLKLCHILEPMKEIMSRQKSYDIDPRDCLRNCLFQKWQRMMNPPEPIRPGKRTTRKRNSSTATGANPMPKSKKKNFASDVMVVGEPSLMGGEFGDDDERMITRLENQFDQNPGTVKSENPDNIPSSFPHTNSPALRSHNNALSPWQQGQMSTPQPLQGQQQLTPQPGANGPTIPTTIQPNSGQQNLALTDTPGPDRTNTPISAQN